MKTSTKVNKVALVEAQIEEADGSNRRIVGNVIASEGENVWLATDDSFYEVKKTSLKPLQVV
jgi:hypothetical protein